MCEHTKFTKFTKLRNYENICSYFRTVRIFVHSVLLSIIISSSLFSPLTSFAATSGCVCNIKPATGAVYSESIPDKKTKETCEAASGTVDYPAPGDNVQDCTWSEPTAPQPNTVSGKVEQVIHLENPIGCTPGAKDCDALQGEVSLPIIIGNVIKKGLGLIGSFALLVFVYGGFEWLSSAGNSDKISKGREAMFWAALGLFVIFISYVIIGILIKVLKGEM